MDNDQEDNSVLQKMNSHQNLSENEIFKCLYEDSLKHVAKCLQLDDEDKVPADIERGFPDLPTETADNYNTDKKYTEFRQLKDDIIIRWQLLLKEIKVNDRKAEKELITQFNQLKRKNKSLQEELDRHAGQDKISPSRPATTDFKTLNEKIESLTFRLSKVAEEIPRGNSPSIADLSDKRGALTLSQMFFETCKKTLPDLLHCLTNKCNRTETEATTQILSSLQGVYEFCISETMITKLNIHRAIEWPDDHNADIDELRDPVSKLVKDFVRDTAEYRCERITKRIKELDSVKPLLDIGGVQADLFITSSSRTCLFMCVQDPFVFLDFSFKYGDHFDTDRLSHYKSSGEVVDYLVWPVMYLYENGAVLTKGVAKGMKQ